MFCGPLGVHNSNSAELMAIKMTLQLYSSSHWVGRKNLFIEPDSKVAIPWVSNSSMRHWNYWSALNEIDNYWRIIGEVELRHILREVNALADSLANFGVDREEMFMAWW
ncbi:Uncharacterized protein TCM_012505 [Theobroma cacao]|uniref:RNase H type-1 domain-containing protein n=1 Tax=Theobroma cacao TaxID=3641 RepID=A0A061FVN7_THECC|nr:Uncharacterized protein TCM_012505 [Theobroma cacao]